MKVRLYNKDKDYQIIIKWWKDHNHNIIESDMLSKYGVVVEENDQLLSMSWLYFQPNCGFGICLWTTVNPSLKGFTREKSINTAIDGIIFLARQLKIEKISLSSNHEKFTEKLINKKFKLLPKHDFLIGDL